MRDTSTIFQELPKSKESPIGQKFAQSVHPGCHRPVDDPVMPVKGQLVAQPTAEARARWELAGLASEAFQLPEKKEKKQFWGQFRGSMLWSQFLAIFTNYVQKNEFS
jgi:hypothetical protein